MDTNTAYDVLIIGAGPAGSSAALYAARASLRALIIEQGMPGGQIATSDMVDNYPGIPDVSGAELGQKMLDHAESAGAEVAYAMVLGIEHAGDGMFTVKTESSTYTAPALIVATGATPRMVGFEGEQTYRGRGISYCATCDGMFIETSACSWLVAATPPARRACICPVSPAMWSWSFVAMNSVRRADVWRACLPR